MGLSRTRACGRMSRKYKRRTSCEVDAPRHIWGGYGVAGRFFGVFALAMALCCAWTSAAWAVRDPLAVVRSYLNALDRHDGSAVCRTFSPQLRTFEIYWDANPGRRRTCTETVDAHFHDCYSRHRWASARIVAVGRTVLDPRREIAAVHLTLAHHYICAGSDPTPQHCHPDIEVRPDVIWLLKSHGSWLILKPGLVYRASEIDSAQDDESIYYPPGDASTITGPARIVTTRFRCPQRGISITKPAGNVSNNANSGPPTVRAPWLDITRLSVSRVTHTVLCFAVTLAAPPRPDTRLTLFYVHELAGGVETGQNFGLDIDGLGLPHPLLNGAGTLSGTYPARVLPQFGLAGKRLELAIAVPPSLSAGSGLHVTAETDSLEIDEPLIAYGCLSFPRGGITHARVCGND
jgi:hypothetical protein